MTNNQTTYPVILRRLLAPIVIASLAACAGQNDLSEPQGDLTTITVISTNDVHGQLMAGHFRGGLTTLSGYVENVRTAREADGGAVLLIDAGDMWQGTMESNLGEGAAMIEAYNALGYTAATIGNHEFDFGPIGDNAIPASADDDPRGVLKQRASEANFPLLNANVVFADTQQRPDWPNVYPSVLIDVHGIDVGIIGVVTARALDTTIAGNVYDLAVLPLADTIEREARQLRDKGADLVIVTAHAGTRCEQPFDDPTDTSRCDLNGEIVHVANALPAGLVDQIVAGHVHEGVAHEFNGIAVTSSYAVTAAFGRVDYVIDAGSGEILERTIYPPQLNCPEVRVATGECVWMSADRGSTRAPFYEGSEVQTQAPIREIADAAVARAAERKNEPLGVSLAAPFTTENNPESTIANLFLTALLEESDADVVVHNVSGGIRAALPAGNLTYGDVYQMFPFDNRVTLHDFSGAELRAIVAAQLHQSRRRAGFAGISVHVECNDSNADVVLKRPDGSVIADDDRMVLLANDFLATAGDGILSPVTPAGGLTFKDDGRLTREALVDWFQRQSGTLSPDDFLGEQFQEWHLPADGHCSL